MALVRAFLLGDEDFELVIGRRIVAAIAAIGGSNGDAINAAAGYNIRRLIAWLRRIWRALLALLVLGIAPPTIAPDT